MPASIYRDIQPLIVASETKVLLCAAGERFKQVILIRGIMGVMAQGAIPGDGRMQHPLSGSGFFIGMAFQAERENRCRGKVYAGDVPDDTHLMAGKTAAFDRRMN